jgi:uncharacterized protein (TIGR03067 family)
MSQRTVVLILFSALPGGAEEKKPDPKADAAALKGVWEIVSTTYDGKEMPAKGRTLVFTDKEFTAFSGEKQGRTVTFTLDPSTDPKRIDLDRGGEDGKAFGIYALDKDELKLCYAQRGAKRPSAFESKEGQKVFLLVLKRTKG